MAKREEIEIKIYGRVQGVRLRQALKGFASNKGIEGFVENKEEGEVFVLAQGEKEKLKDFLSFIQKSPGFSKVTGLNYTLREAGKNYNGFKIVKKRNFFVDQARSILNLGKFFVGKREIKIPKHIVIIPDGNRRWAKEKGFEGTFGHYKSGSYDNMESLFKAAEKSGVKFMSIWGFSTENWNREKGEIKAIFELILSGVEKFRKDAEKNKIRFIHVGRRDRIPEKLKKALEKLEKETKKYDSFSVILCLDYGGREEITRAVNRLLKSGKKEIEEEDIRKELYTVNIPDPDLIIRTSGEKRVSGFMPFQSAYAELYFSEKYFPDFNAEDLKEAIRDYGNRDRRFGGNSKKK